MPVSGELVEVGLEQRASKQQSRRRKGGKEKRESSNPVSATSVVSSTSCSSSGNNDSSNRNGYGSSTSFVFTAGSGGGSGNGSRRDSVFSTSASVTASIGPWSLSPDYDSLLSQLAGYCQSGGGDKDPDPDPEWSRDPYCDTNINIIQQHQVDCVKCASVFPPHFYSTPTHNTTIGTDEEEEEVAAVEEERVEITVLDPAKHSFSLALRECQNRRFRSERLPLSSAPRKQLKRRLRSPDANSHMSDSSVSSPRSFIAGVGSKKSSTTSVLNRSVIFPTPGTPNYWHGALVPSGYQKGWYSERVPLPVNAGRRFGSSTALLPLGNGGKVFPSKWEDAEKWICSPVSGTGVGLKQPTLPSYHRRPKSKSGPIGAPGGIGGCYSVSPSLHGLDGGRIPNIMTKSPFSTGVIVPESGCCGDGNGDRKELDGARSGGCRPLSAQSDQGRVRSASAHVWSDLLTESSSSLQSSRDETLVSSKDCATNTVSSVVLRKDIGTQMSPGCSSHSSSEDCPQASLGPHSSLTIGELHHHFSKIEVRDVQVDDQITTTRWPQKLSPQGLSKSPVNNIKWNKKVDSQSSNWEDAEMAKCISSLKREEVKITAWENLQKAKAEAAIQKLERKLEKKRSSSMDTILSKLRAAQRKAKEMRNVVNTDQTRQVSTISNHALIFPKRSHMGLLSSCFTCHAL